MTAETSPVPSDDALERELSDFVWKAVFAELTVDLDAIVPADRSDLHFVLKRVRRRAEFARLGRENVFSDGLRDRLKQYVVEKLLGTGGMGEVFLVRSRSSGRRFALKRVRRQSGVFLGGVEFRMAREQQLFQELLTWIGLPRHGNLVACCFFRCLGNELAIFSEYVPGGSLREMIISTKESPAVDMLTVVDLALQTLAGLTCLHAHGVTHQDIKPQNILVGGKDRVVFKINDFGISRSWKNACHLEPGSAVEEEVPVGGFDPVFCSPEQRTSSVVSSATDIWNWALTMLFAVTGEVTWEKGQAPSLAPLEATHGEPGRSLARILEPCLHADPQLRPNASCLQEELRPVYHQLAGRDFEDIPVGSLAELSSMAHDFYLDHEARDLLRQFSSTENTEAFLLMNKAARLCDARSFDQASQCLRRAYRLLKDKYGDQRFRPWTVRLAAALIHVGQVYDNVRQHDRAVEHIELGIDILQQLAGPPHVCECRPLPFEIPSRDLLSLDVPKKQTEASDRSASLARPLRSRPATYSRVPGDSEEWHLLRDVSPSRLEQMLPDLKAMVADIRRKH